MSERIKITVRAASTHRDILTVQDAMRQVLDIFQLLTANTDSAVEWKLAHATTNSPFLIEGEAVSPDPNVDVSVIARAQKQDLARNLGALASGKRPTEIGFPIPAAKRLLNRNLNGIGKTTVDFEFGDPIELTPIIAREAIRAIENKPEGLFDLPSPRDEIGTIEGTLRQITTHWNHPAARVVDSRTNELIWCRLTKDLQKVFADKATFRDVWQHQRVFVRGRIKYAPDGGIEYVLANDIQRIESKPTSLKSIKDVEFTDGLSVSEYLDRFREGTLG